MIIYANHGLKCAVRHKILVENVIFPQHKSREGRNIRQK